MVHSKASSQSKSRFFRRQALMWLISLVLLSAITAFLWMMNKTPAFHQEVENKPLTPQQILEKDLIQPKKIESLHELDKDVPPINFDTVVRDLRHYPDEFKDKRYLNANKGKWTVQVMNVAENEVITDYLMGRQDRDKFAYFRYRDENNQPRYMLIYGIMSSPQEAIGTAKIIDFGLPRNVRPLPEEINRYIDIIDNYEKAEPVKEANMPRIIELKPAKKEVPSKVIDDSSSEAEAVNHTDQSIKHSLDTSDTLSIQENKTQEKNDEVEPTKKNTKPKSGQLSQEDVAEEAPKEQEKTLESNKISEIAKNKSKKNKEDKAASNPDDKMEDDTQP